MFDKVFFFFFQEAQVATLQGQLNSEREETRTKEATEAEKNKSTLHSHILSVV